jgi:hypothetical protein
MRASNKLERQYSTIGVKHGLSGYIKSTGCSWGCLNIRVEGRGDKGMTESCRSLRSEEFEYFCAHCSSRIRYTIVKTSRKIRWMKNAARME